MAVKVIFVFCVSALIQSAFSQCLGRGAAIGTGLSPLGLAGTGLAYEGMTFGTGCGVAAPASSGGGFSVTSASAIPPVGVTVVSENVYEGALAAGGDLPFLGTVALESVLPTAGAGAANYGCGNGAIGIVSEGPIATGIVADELALAPGLAGGLGYNAGLAPGLGYRGIGPLRGCARSVY